MMPRLINTAMLSHPANWVTVTLMTAIALFGVHQLIALNQTQTSTT